MLLPQLEHAENLFVGATPASSFFLPFFFFKRVNTLSRKKKIVRIASQCWTTFIAWIPTNFLHAPAATSSARAAGLSTVDIIKMAGWSWQSTLEKFYHKPIVLTLFVVVSSATNGMSSNNTQCHICSLVMTWNCRSHKRLKDVQWDQNFISDKASIWNYPLQLYIWSALPCHILEIDTEKKG